MFAGILLGIAGFLNVIWGIAGVSDSKFFTANSVWVVSSLHTWGWITLIIGVVELFAAFSLFSGGSFGKVIGIVARPLSARSRACCDPAPPRPVLVDLRVRPVNHHHLRSLQDTGR